MRYFTSFAAMMLAVCPLAAQHTEMINYGNFNNWVTRHIHESGVIGGKEKIVYEIGPASVIDGNKAYVPSGGSPWATSNVYAKVSGITKGSNAVFPFDRGAGNKCAKLSTIIEHVKVLGIVNMDVMVAGSIFLGRIYEPITSTKGPYGKMDMGIRYTKRPKALQFDYKVDMPSVNTRMKASGFGSKKTIQGRDKAVVFVLLQRRWEDADGKLHAKRVGTAGKLFAAGSDWVNGFSLPIVYGNASEKAGYSSYLGLRGAKNAYYGKNSKGKLVPVIEEGWDEEDATPTHLILMMSAGSGEPYVGTEGLNLYVDNVGFQF